MGPHFERADKRIGKRRLPTGYVAVLNDDATLVRVLAELHAYSLSSAGVNLPPAGVLFRHVGTGEKERVVHRLIELFAAAKLMDQSATAGLDETYHYVINSRGMTQAWNRHSDPVGERQHGQKPLDPSDGARVPQAIQARNIVAFGVVNGTPRVVYESRSDSGTLVVVVEIQHGRKWLAMTTAFKRK